MAEPDVVVAKVAALERSLTRIEEVTAGRASYPRPLDAEELIVLHLQRAAQAAIDLAGHVVATEGFGLPATLAETFTLLEQNGIVDPALAVNLRRMVGFRNIAVHQYETIAPAVVEAIVARHLQDLRQFADLILQRFGLNPPPTPR
jgi:uncharacterized protein YutE (UPF0331/DUF86 family)